MTNAETLADAPYLLYCLSCQEAVVALDADLRFARGGRPRLEALCAVCGGMVSRFTGRTAEREAGRMLTEQWYAALQAAGAQASREVRELHQQRDYAIRQLVGRLAYEGLRVEWAWIADAFGVEAGYARSIAAGTQHGARP